MWLPPKPGSKSRKFIVRSQKKINIAHGPVRTGKTVDTIMRFIHFVARAPQGDLFFIGKTERTIYRNVIAPMLAFLPQEAFSFSRGAGMGQLLGRTIEAIGFNNINAPDKIQGSTTAGFLGDEITLWPGEAFNMLTTRMSVEGARGFGTTNPGAPNHWLKKEWLDNETVKPDLFDLAYELDDNPHLDPEFVKFLKRSYSGVFYKRFILGLWVAAEGSIYDMFDESLHTWEDDPGFKIDRRYVGVDYGTKNPCTFGMYALNSAYALEPKIALENEYYYSSKDHSGQTKTDSQYADDLVKFVGVTDIEGVIVDPSAASFIAEIEARGFNVILGKNDVLNGIRTVSAFITNLRFKMHAACTHSIGETQGYAWDDKASLKGEDKPIKENDHCPDRDRYVIYTLFGKPLNEKVSAVYHA
jgi:PBSX family phage terminase large subunit